MSYLQRIFAIRYIAIISTPSRYPLICSFFSDVSVLFLQQHNERNLQSVILNSSQGRSSGDLSSRVAHRHYSKRITAVVVENLSASKLVLLSEYIIYQFCYVPLESPCFKLGILNVHDLLWLHSEPIITLHTQYFNECIQFFMWNI